MANPFRYCVELRSTYGTTRGLRVIAHSGYAAMQLPLVGLGRTSA
jgi:hypothetical protein